MRTTVLLIIVGILFTLSVFSGTAAVLTYWWVAIFRPHDWAWQSVLYDLHITKVAAGLFLFHAITRKRLPRPNNLIAILMLVFLLLTFIASSVNGCPDFLEINTSTVFEIAILLCVVLITVEYLKDKSNIFWLILLISLSLGFHSGKSGIYALITGGDNYGAQNLTGMFSGSNAYALFSGMFLFFMFFTIQFFGKVAWRRRTLPPYLTKVFVPVMLITIFGTFYNIVSLQSRGAFLATAIGLIVWVVLHRKRVFLITFLSIVITSMYMAIPLPDNYVERISSAFAEPEERDKSAESRPYFWGVAIDMAMDHPIGIGAGCYPAYYDKYDKTEGFYGNFRSVHSSHFQVMSDSGFAGLAVWLLLFVVSYRRLWRIRTVAKNRLCECSDAEFIFYLSNALIAAMTVYLIGSSFYEYAYVDIIWLTWGLVIALDRLVKKSPHPNSPSRDTGHYSKSADRTI